MSFRLLDGKAVAAAINEQVAAKAAACRQAGVTPTLGILRVGEREDDLSYERGATKRAEAVGIAVARTVLPEGTTTEELLAKIAEINADPAIHGLLMFRPLPKGIDEDAACAAIDPAKDVDACTEGSLSALFTGAAVGYAPCTAQACIEILDHYGIPIEGKRAIVVGRSLVIGKPVAMMLLARNATVTIAHSRTRDLPSVVREADIVVAAVGRARMLSADCFRAGQVVVDVGINFEGGKLVGDVDFEAASGIVDAATPVPGGVGSVTTSVLCKHVAQAAKAMCAVR